MSQVAVSLQSAKKE